MAGTAVASTLTSQALQPLREQVRGRVIAAADEDYDEARSVHNGMFDRRPTAILKAEQVGDVIAGVNLAGEHGLDLSVRCGGHSGPGFGTNEAGLVIDMSEMRTVRVDPRSKTARADAGATLGDFNYATHAFGLATTGGIISTTGLTGLTLGGGIGYLSRARADDRQPDLGRRGDCGREVPDRQRTGERGSLLGAPRRGWQFRRRDLPRVPPRRGRPVFAGPTSTTWTTLRPCCECSTNYSGRARGVRRLSGFQIAPPLPFIPEDRHGDTLFLVVVHWAGPLDQAEKALKPFREVAPIVADGAVHFPIRR